MKDFSHRDQAPDADVDVHEGIEATLTISAHQVPHGLRIVRISIRTSPRCPVTPAS